MIELFNVTKRFAATLAVDDVSLSIHAGEFLTLLGPSGCGKTTILRLISGFESPDVGTISLDGIDVTHVPPNHRDVNQVFQSYALFPHLTVAKNIEFGLRMKRLSRSECVERTGYVIHMLALQGFENRKPAQLSGGQKQRVALARAIVNQPKVLLLDEPLAALDAKLRRAVQLELKQLQRKLGITFVFVTHDQDEALTMSDRIAVMSSGKIEQLATSQEIYHKPQTRFVAEFVGQNNLLKGRVTEKLANNRLRLRVDESLDLIVDGARNIGDDVLVSVRPERIQINSSCDSSCDENVFSAIVIEQIFRGEVTQLIVRCNSGLILHALSTDSCLKIGAAIRCSIESKNLIPIGA